jgi:uncharacterized membrane protein YphA (DoxX/SURF4 family)
MGASSTVGPFPSSLDTPAWKATLNHIAAFLTALLFIAAGGLKILLPFEVQRMMENLHVYSSVSLPFTLALGTVELFTGIMLLIPRFRRWGGIIASLLLISFMGYIGLNYNALVGQDCSCIPWLKRAVNIWFFPEDAAMLIVSSVAALWAKPSYSKRGAAVILGACAVFAAISFGAALTHQSGTKAPDTILVKGQPYSLQNGRVFIFFFDPECSHCVAAAKAMATYTWKSDVRVVGVPTKVPKWAEPLLKDPEARLELFDGFKGVTTPDLAKLKAVFPGDTPYAVALENGRSIGMVTHYEENDEPRPTLKKLGFIE